ncbi:MAG: PCRF domain-containing protein, partial [Burkholderiales bacterium]
MKPSIVSKLANLSARLEELNALLSAEDATQDMNSYRQLAREHAEITPVVELYQTYLQTQHEIESALELADDPEMGELAETEIESGREKLLVLEEKLQKLLLPKDPNDDKNIFLEIRAGTGGDESALFAGDL